MADKKIRVSTKTNVKKGSAGWVVSIIVFAFLTSLVFSYISTGAIPNVPLWAAFVILAAFILVGILFDVIGVAVTSGDEAPFHSMSTRRVKGARQSVWLIRNAEKVSNFCNDVVGDIAGIISGVATTVVVLQMVNDEPYLSILMTSLVAAITIGGKAVGKSIAMTNSNQIIYSAGVCLYYLGVARKKGR